MISTRARIGIRNTNVEYSGKVTLMCLGPRIKIIGTLSDISLDIDLAVGNNLVATVNKFGVSRDGDLKLEFQNLENFEHLPDKVNLSILLLGEQLLTNQSLLSDIAGVEN